MTRESIERRLFLDTSSEFQRAVRHAPATPSDASGAIALGVSLAVDEAIRLQREEVIVRTLDVMVRGEQAWNMARTVEAVVRG